MPNRGIVLRKPIVVLIMVMPVMPFVLVPLIPAIDGSVPVVRGSPYVPPVPVVPIDPPVPFDPADWNEWDGPDDPVPTIAELKQVMRNRWDRPNPFDDPVVRDAWVVPITTAERIAYLESKILDMTILSNGWTSSSPNPFLLYIKEYRRQLHDLHNQTKPVDPPKPDDRHIRHNHFMLNWKK